MDNEIQSIDKKTPETVTKQEEQCIKLGPWGTYFSLLKGFVAIGFLYMPKNCLNGGWAFSLFAMALSFTVTFYSMLKLL